MADANALIAFASRLKIAALMTPSGARSGGFDITLAREDGREYRLSNAVFYDPAKKRAYPITPELDQVLESLAPAYGDAPEETAAVRAFFGAEYDEFVALTRRASKAA